MNKLFLVVLAALLACKSTPPTEGKFQGRVALSGDSSAAFEDTTVEVTSNAIKFATGTPLANCKLDVTSAPNASTRTVISQSSAGSCMLGVDATTLEATVTGTIQPTGKGLDVSLNIANIEPSTRNTGTRSWTLKFTGTK